MANITNLKTWLVISIFLAVLVVQAAVGRTIYVKTTGDNFRGKGSSVSPYRTIQKGIDSAVDGDTVLVADGTYSGDGNRDLDFNGKAITVTSENGAEATIIDCQGREEEPHRGFYFHSGETLLSVVDGFTIKNGYGPWEPFSSSTFSVGGGIYCTNSSPTITNNIITGNTATYGGGIQCWEYSSPRVTNNVITRNSSSEGAGIWCYNYCSATISNNIITENIAVWGGGGVKIDLASSAEVVNNVIAENSAQWKGGGIYCGNSSPVIINNTLADNSSQHEGGGIYIWGNASPLIVNTILWGDSPEEIALGGGGSFIITYSCVQDGWPGAGNINANPLFFDAANANYCLQDGSPCINAGDNSAFPRSLVEDIDGNPRITDGIVDMGAYEFGMAAIPHEAKYSGGMGEPHDPYQIATAEDLILLGESIEDYDKHFILTADIDLDPNLPGRRVFKRAVIASNNEVIWWGEFDGVPFTGIFDGNSHIISNLTIDGAYFVGLFGQLGEGADVSNLGIEAMDVNGTGGYVGGLVGRNSLGSSITDCYVTGSVNGTADYVGGLVGENIGYFGAGGNITNCYSACMVSGDGSVGGLVGCNLMGNIAASTSTIIVSGNRSVGGLVGRMVGGDLSLSYSNGTVSGDNYVGGLIGYNSVQYWEYYIASNITECYSSCTVTGITSVGGLIGHIMGYDESGYNGPYVRQCYSNGEVKGDENVGGLVGYNWFGSISVSFWDMETSGQTESDGGTGLSTIEMQTANTFLQAGWDFVDETENGTENIWWIDEGQDYPRLWWELIDDVTPDIDLVISSPIPDERFVRGEEISFSVMVSGKPDLDGFQLEWTSDKDGYLGTGFELTLDNLSTGSHVIEVCGYGVCTSISVRIYEDLWQLYQSSPAEGEIERILNDFSFNLIDGDESDEKWDAYDHVFDQNSRDPSFLVAISKIDMLRRQRFSKPVPFTNGQTIYDHFKTYVKTINLKLDCSYNSAGGDQVNLNRNFSVWDGRVSGTPSNWDACKIPFPNYSLYDYTNAIYLLMHEVRHCEPSDPGHRICNGRPSDEMLEDGGGYAQSALYLMWVYKYSLYDPLFIRNEARFTATMLLKERICTTPTHSDPNVQAIIDELLN
jgi:hypothetical protein